MALTSGAANSKTYRVKITNFCGDITYSPTVVVGICGLTTTITTPTVSDSAATSGQAITVDANITDGNYTATTGFAYQWEVSTDGGSNYSNASGTQTSGTTGVTGAGGGSIAVPQLGTTA